MRICLMAPNYRSAYDIFVEQQSQSLLYHSSRYIDFLVDLLACEQTTLLVVDEFEAVVGALPLLSKSGPLGQVLNSLPYYGSNGGILGDDPICIRMLLEHYNEILKSGRVAAATIVENPLQRMDPVSVSHNLTDERIGQFTPLRYDANHSEQLMMSFHYKTRNMIRKAEKLGVVVAVENDQLEFVRDTHVENMTEIGGVPKSAGFFELIPRHFRANTDYRIYTARLDGELVAAVLVFYFNHTVEYYTPVICKQYRETQALSAAIFTAMTEASIKGYHRWNWGGTWLSQEGVYRFKKRWATQDLPYSYYTNLVNRGFLDMTREQILADYPSFYTVPFSMLRG